MNIVVLHGWGHSASLWQNFANKLHSHKVLMLNLPGFGSEKLVSENWDISDYANWVIKRLENKKIKDAVFIGHSFGGKIATEIAIKNPELVTKLILVAAPVLRRPSAQIKIKVAFYKLFKKVMPAAFRRLFFVPEYKDASKNQLGEIFKKSVEYDRTKEIQKIKIPVLVIWGDKDGTAPTKIAKEMHSLFPNSKIEVLKGYGHNLQLENPDLLYGLVNKFTNETG